MIEQLKSLLTADQRLLTDEEGEILVNIMLAPNDAFEKEFTQEVANELGFTGKILYSRLNANSDVKIDLGVAFFVLQLAGGNPGNIVMWAYTLHRGNLLTLAQFINYFSSGVPSEKGYEETWDAQKVRTGYGDNGLDNPDNWK